MNSVPFTSVPVEVTIGIDQYSFNVEANQPFQGIKDIPIDHVHVIHFQHADDSGMRYGYWFDGKTGNYYIQYDFNDVFTKWWKNRIIQSSKILFAITKNGK